MNFMSKHILIVIVIIFSLSFFFLILAIGYSQSYSPGLFPDEFAHMGYVNDVIKHHFPDYTNGLIYSSNKLNYLNHPALYYFIVGELASIMHLQDAFAYVGRYLNMFISIIIIVLICCMLYRATYSRLATFMGGAFLLVIPMFILLGSAVSNDQINVLGCTFVIYGLLGLMEFNKNHKPLTSYIIFICVGGIIASLSKATGSLVIVCLLGTVTLFNFTSMIKIIKKISPKQWLIIITSIAIVVIYFSYIHNVYGQFYPAPQGTPALWFFIEHTNAKRLGFSEFFELFLFKNLMTLIIPYGHIYFPDSEARIFLTKAVLIVLAIMSVFILIKKNSKDKYFYDVTSSFIVAFFIFLTIYFFIIREMHLNTGYTGAMQARYFFGFLPIFSLVLAKTLCWVKSKAIKGIVSLMIISGLTMSFYPALVKIIERPVLCSATIIEQPFSNNSYGYLTKGRSFAQTILAESNYLNGVELMIATYTRKNHGPLTLELVDNTGKIIANSVVRMETLTDNSYAWFDFNRVKIIKKRKYTLRLKCPDCTQDNAITWSGISKEVELPIFLMTKFGPDAKDKYSQGEAYVDGVKVGGSYSFRLYFQ